MSLVLGVIPARFGSTRFPGKPLATLGTAFDGRTLLHEVWRRASRSSRLSRLVVATDDERIAEAARGFGAQVAMTSDEHPSGSDRVAEVARSVEDASIVVNIQGDEPLLTATGLDRLLEPFDEAAPPEMATLWEPFDSLEDVDDPSQVKVVIGPDGNALYFSRAAIPFARDAEARRPENYRKHQGIYAFRRDALLALTALPPSALERAEGLEQLRALEAGFRIRVVRSDFRSRSVDTPEDLARLQRMLLEAD